MNAADGWTRGWLRGGRLPHRCGGRGRRHGDRLRRHAAAAEPARGAEGDRSGPGQPGELPRAVQERVAAGGLDRAPQRDPGLRGGGDRRAAVPGHALRGGDRPPRAARSRGQARARPGGRADGPGRSGAVGRPPPGPGAPRRQAGQRAGGHRSPGRPRARVPDRLRHRPRDRRHRRHHPHRRGGGDDRLPGPRALRGRARRHPVRRLRLRLHALRGARGRGALPARLGGGDDVRARQRARAVAERAAARRARRAGRGGRALHGEGPRRALPRRGGDGPGHRGRGGERARAAGGRPGDAATDHRRARAAPAAAGPTARAGTHAAAAASGGAPVRGGPAAARPTTAAGGGDHRASRREAGEAPARGRARGAPRGGGRGGGADPRARRGWARRGEVGREERLGVHSRRPRRPHRGRRKGVGGERRGRPADAR